MALSKSEGLKLAALTSLFLVFSLITREYLRRYLLDRAFADEHAAVASAGAGIVLLALAAWPLFVRFRLTLARYFRRPASVPVTLLIGAGFGLLCRMLDWLYLVAAGDVGGQAISVNIACSRPAVVSFPVSVLGLPLAEEIIHRGILLSALVPFGVIPAVLASALIFAVLHTSFITPFLFGVFGASVALRSGTLWIPLLAHSTFNFMQLAEAACLQVVPTSNGGFRIDPLSAALAATLAIICLATLTLIAGTGTPGRSGTGPTWR